MNEFSAQIFDQLDAYTPEPDRWPDWRDVVRRARRQRTRRLVVTFAAALTVFASAAGVTAALGGFDRWLSGEPGKPAPYDEQQKFEAANGRTWAAFPKGTQLRELIRTEVGGKTYALFGFRSGDTLCLKLKAVSLGHSTDSSCTPTATVAHSTAPIVVVNRDWGFTDKHARTSAQVSFGIVSDGVRRVEVLASDGSHHAVVGGNAYLFVENEPNTGNRVIAVSARSSTGRLSTMRFGTTDGFFDGSPDSGRPARGPTKVEARIAHPTIGWYVRGERRGRSRDELHLGRNQMMGVSAYARLVKPDPLSDIVVGLDANICMVVATGPGPGMGCNTRQAFFALGPLNVMTFGGGGAESLIIAGAAADGVEKLTVFGSDGQKLSVPLRDNLFAARVALTQFPIRLVGYDRRGRITAVRKVSSSLIGDALPASAWTPTAQTIRVQGPNGATADLGVTQGTERIRCWRVRFSTGQSRRGCNTTEPRGPWVYADLVQQAGRDLFVVGNVRAPVKLVKLRFEDGRTLTARPVADLYVFSVPRAYLSTKRQLAFVRGYDAHGLVVQRAAVLFKLRSR